MGISCFGGCCSATTVAIALPRTSMKIEEFETTGCAARITSITRSAVCDADFYYQCDRHAIIKVDRHRQTTGSPMCGVPPPPTQISYEGRTLSPTSRRLSTGTCMVQVPVPVVRTIPVYGNSLFGFAPSRLLLQYYSAQCCGNGPIRIISLVLE